MTRRNVVYIAASLDGFIADREGRVDWLDHGESSSDDDYGFVEFINGIDALVMGRSTFDFVHDFGVWPYDKPVFVLSNSMAKLPDEYEGKAELMKGDPTEIVAALNARGFVSLYVDGGRTVQDFLGAGLIDEMIVTRIPVVLGGGAPLFGALDTPVWFDHVKTKTQGNHMVQSHYVKRRGATK